MVASVQPRWERFGAGVMFLVLVPLPVLSGCAQSGVFSAKNQGSAVVLCAVGPSPLAVASGCFLGMFFGGAGYPVTALPAVTAAPTLSQCCWWGWGQLGGPSHVPRGLGMAQGSR